MVALGWDRRVGVEQRGRVKYPEMFYKKETPSPIIVIKLLEARVEISQGN